MPNKSFFAAWRERRESRRRLELAAERLRERNEKKQALRYGPARVVDTPQWFLEGDDIPERRLA